MAMRKYGVENFEVSLIEETDNPEEREVYWIEQKRSFKNGYNATLGGDGKRYIDHDLVIATYQEMKSAVDTAKKLGICEETVRTIIKSNQIKSYSAQEVMTQKFGNLVNQYDMNMNFIQSFPSLRAAARALGKAGVSHISDACKGKRQSAYGFKWQFAEQIKE